MHGMGIELTHLRRLRREIDDAEHAPAARRHDAEINGGAILGAGKIGRRLIRHPDEARHRLRVRPHLLVRVGAVQQHHRLVLAIDRGDHAANVCAQGHGCVSPILNIASRNSRSCDRARRFASVDCPGRAFVLPRDELG